MTGTAKTEEVEFEKTYKLESTVVPTNQVRRGKIGLIKFLKQNQVNGKQLLTKLLIFIKKEDQF